MGDQKNLIVGFDLCESYTQLSVFNKKALEPETINITVPTALGIKNDKKEWLFGEEAYQLSAKGEGIVIDKLLEKVCLGEDVEIFAVKFSPITLMEKYLRKCLQILKKYYPTESILMLCITLKQTNTILREGILTALEALGIGKERVMIQNHTGSYGSYALCQQKELWMSDIGLFDFDEEGLTYHQITIDRKSVPPLAAISSKELNEELSFEQVMGTKDNELLDRLNYFFLNLAKNTLHRQYVTTLYVTGKGFEGTWADNALKELCSGRRVFKGQNLYSKGACYAAEKQVTKNTNEFILMDNEMITTDISIKGIKDGKLSDILLIKGAQPWYNAKNSSDFILDECNSIILYLKDRLKYQVREETIELTDLPVRPSKTTRVELQICFLDKETVKIIIKDKGFGTFYPPSNKKWIQEINI
jgi:hypothetical protein